MHDHYILVRYTLCCRVASEEVSNYVAATDAHDGCGHKLHNTVIGMPGNVLALGLPQVITYIAALKGRSIGS